MTKFVDDLPSTVFVGDEYLDDRNPHKHFKKVVPEHTLAPKNFDIRSKATVLSYDQRSSKKIIEPVHDSEK